MATDEPQSTSTTSSALIEGDDGATSASEQNVATRISNSHSQGHRLQSDERLITGPSDEFLVREASGEPVANQTCDEPELPGGVINEDQHRQSFVASTGALLKCALGPGHVFRPIAVPKDYPKLKYKPIMLRFRCMLCVLTFYLIVLGLLITLIPVNNVSFSSQYGYFSIQILPPLIGTITASLWRAITVTVSRISPYIASASNDPIAYKWRNSAQRTILARYFPIPDIIDMIRNGNGLLIFTYILWVLSNTVLAFKAVLLNTTNYNDYWKATVTFPALLALLTVYLLLITGLIALMWHLWGIQTGLLWDPVSIADHLVLFRDSNFLAEFDGTEATSLDSLRERFQNSHFRLGYWDRGSLGIWHGFGRIGHDLHGKLPFWLSCLISRLTSFLDSVRKNAPDSAAASISDAPDPNQVDSAQSLLSTFKLASSRDEKKATCRSSAPCYQCLFVLKR